MRLSTHFVLLTSAGLLVLGAPQIHAADDAPTRDELLVSSTDGSNRNVLRYELSTGKFLGIYNPEPSGKSEPTHPNGLAVGPADGPPDTQLFVANACASCSEGAVVELSLLTGGTIATFTDSLSESLGVPAIEDLALLPGGLLYVSDRAAEQIVAIDPQQPGSPTVINDVASPAYPKGLTFDVDEDGLLRLWAIDDNQQEVRVFDVANGEELEELDDAAALFDQTESFSRDLVFGPNPKKPLEALQLYVSAPGVNNVLRYEVGPTDTNLGPFLQEVKLVYLPRTLTAGLLEQIDAYRNDGTPPLNLTPVLLPPEFKPPVDLPKSRRLGPNIPEPVSLNKTHANLLVGTDLDGFPDVGSKPGVVPVVPGGVATPLLFSTTAGRLGVFYETLAAIEPSGLAFSPDDEFLLVADRANDSILRFDAESGALVDVLVRPGVGNGGLRRPSYITVAQTDIPPLSPNFPPDGFSADRITLFEWEPFGDSEYCVVFFDGDPRGAGQEIGRVSASESRLIVDPDFLNKIPIQGTTFFWQPTAVDNGCSGLKAIITGPIVSATFGAGTSTYSITGLVQSNFQQARLLGAYVAVSTGRTQESCNTQDQGRTDDKGKYSLCVDRDSFTFDIQVSQENCVKYEQKFRLDDVEVRGDSIEADLDVPLLSRSSGLGLYQKKKGNFSVRNSLGNGSKFEASFKYGPRSGKIVPVIGDWDGKGGDTTGLYDQKRRAFHLKNTNSAGETDLQITLRQKSKKLVPVVGDWDGDGVVTIGTYDRKKNIFDKYESNAADSKFEPVEFPVPGGKGAMPIAGDWNGDCRDDVGLYRPGKKGASGVFLIRVPNGFDEWLGIPLNFEVRGSKLQPIVGNLGTASSNGNAIYDTVGVYDPIKRKFVIMEEDSQRVIKKVGPKKKKIRKRIVPLFGNWDGR